MNDLFVTFSFDSPTEPGVTFHGWPLVFRSFRFHQISTVRGQFSYKNPNRKTVCPTDPTVPTAVNGCDLTIYDVYESLRGRPNLYGGSPGLVTSQRQESLEATLVGLAQRKRYQPGSFAIDLGLGM